MYYGNRQSSRSGYDGYINSAAWTNKKKAVVDAYRHNGWDVECIKCGGRDDLQVHHNYYIKNAYLGQENISDLDYLCTTCHNAWHAIQKLSGLSQNDSFERYYLFVTDKGRSPRKRIVNSLFKIKLAKDEDEIIAFISPIESAKRDYFSRPDVNRYIFINNTCSVLFGLSIILLFVIPIGSIIGAITILITWFVSAANNKPENYDLMWKGPESYALFLQKKVPVEMKNLILKNYLVTEDPSPDYYNEALYYYNLGFNITLISRNSNQHNSNAENTFLKAPAHEWERLVDVRQSRAELDSYDWKDANGIGIVTGFNNLVVLDIDNGSETFLMETMSSLSLPTGYVWTVRSGGRHGFHVYFFLPNIQDVFKKTTVIRLFPKPSYNDQIEKVELLLRLHAVLPPSAHPTGNRYAFFYGARPTTLPAHVSPDLLNTYIEKYFEATKTKNTTSSKTSPARVSSTVYNEALSS